MTDALSQNLASALSELADALAHCGFMKTTGNSFRYVHPATDVMIELVGETIKVAHISAPGVSMIAPDDIDDPVVRSLMAGPAEVLDPVMTFLNFLDASRSDSHWYAYEDEGALAVERAHALLALYGKNIRAELKGYRTRNELGDDLVNLLENQFGVKLRR